MADERQFGSPKRMQFGDTDTQTGVALQCAQCEAMLADALDGTLAADRQNRMDAHVTECALCSQMLADARRGAAWLEMLRTPRPEPPATLLEQILAATSGAQGTITAGRMVARGVDPVGAAGGITGRMDGVAPAFVSTGSDASYSNVVPFRVRATATLRNSSLGQIALQPRFAMTAAMAFFSIALTMNLTGVHPLSLHVSDLRPSAVKRNLADADARVVRYYEGLRVVYEWNRGCMILKAPRTAIFLREARASHPIRCSPLYNLPLRSPVREIARTLLRQTAIRLSARGLPPIPAPAVVKDLGRGDTLSPSVDSAWASTIRFRNQREGDGMNCANHPDRERTAFCQNCGKPVCSECVRNIGSSTYCEPCMTARLGATAPPSSFPYPGYPYPGNPQPDPVGYPPAVPPVAVGEPSPGLAALLGFIPGVGAMYNGQYAKGIVHLIVFAVLAR